MLSMLMSRRENVVGSGIIPTTARVLWMKTTHYDCTVETRFVHEILLTIITQSFTPQREETTIHVSNR